jgi:sucrose phosphorylase
MARAWSERDVLLIAYADSIAGDGVPLQRLRSFVAPLTDAISIVHVLPFFPSSSDGGFAVIDHDAVDPRLGAWADVEALAGVVDVMADLVVNHVSSRSPRVAELVAGQSPGRDWFVTADPADDLSMVTRPRTTPLLHRFGDRWVWCTFGPDQLDVDLRNPAVVDAMLATTRNLVAHGVSLIRLDAIAYAWKDPGTSCVNRPGVHALVRRWRDEATIVTETNLPDAENRSYLGTGDEAHAIYNFTLPPLVLDAVWRSDPSRLAAWLAAAPPTPPGTALLNVFSTHDGIGLRPAEGILTDDELDALAARVPHGSYGRAGTPRPYELHATAWTALGGDGPCLLAQSLLLALAGVPAFYVHGLCASPDQPGVGRDRNRGPVDPAAVHGSVPTELLRRAALRRTLPAFHPDAPQRVWADGPLLVVERGPVTAVHNVSAGSVPAPPGTDLLGGGPGPLPPHGVRWLT